MTADWLYSCEYVEVDKPHASTLESALRDDGAYTLAGEPISMPVKAKEATPKYMPPLFEEREV